jgi:hypothetical protein
MQEMRPGTLEPLEQGIDHVCGPAAARLILEYGDYECPYSRQAFREIERVEQQLAGQIRFAFRHFPLTEIHPHALAAAAAAEAAARQGRFWEMHDLLFHRQPALEDDDPRKYAAQLELDVERFNHDQGSDEVLARIRRDVESAQRVSATCSHLDDVTVTELPDEIAGSHDDVSRHTNTILARLRDGTMLCDGWRPQ